MADSDKRVLIEVVDAEKLLWALIHSKGLLDPDVKNLYCKTCAFYEKIILNGNDMKDFHDVEYSLWKVHYKFIDEFRKRMQKTSTNPDAAKLDDHVEGFRSFLSEAMRYYQDLIVNIRHRYGLLEEPLFSINDGISTSFGKKNVEKCQFSCHCFLVRLGDLARYKEFYEKTDVESRSWSVAATYYLEATRIWPDKGNPQNQLAVLATYVHDEFAALYHCVRSAAVKEPFPDAWDNLVVLLEKNRSSHLSSLSTDAHFNLSKPSERSNVLLRSQPSDQHELWSLFVRIISFFYIKSRLEDFNSMFASTMCELEALMEFDDRKLKGMFESFQHMDSTRTGPCRVLQVVSIFIFIIEDLMKRQKLRELTDSSGIEWPEWTKLSISITFICTGRFVDRCLKSDSIGSCPLLPAVLVLMEWLEGALEKVETFGANEVNASAMSYFFSSLAKLLNQFDNTKSEDLLHGPTALWEDYELLGFKPLARVHEALDFSASQDCRNGFENRSPARINRLICAATNIVNRSYDSQKWMAYDEVRRKFYVPGSNKFPERTESEVKDSGSDLKEQGRDQSRARATQDSDQLLVEDFVDLGSSGGPVSDSVNPGSNGNPIGDSANPSANGKSVAMEEDEVILFKPITRYNSAPICSSFTLDDQTSPELENIRSLVVPPSEENLRRASSHVIAQNQGYIDPLPSSSNMTNIRCSSSPRQQELFSKDSPAYPFSEGPISAGPPSLSGWLLNKGSLSIDHRGKATNPVEGASSISLAALSISETEDTVADPENIPANPHYSSPPYTAPVPSAPLLPDDGVWFSGESSWFPQYKSLGATRETDNYYVSSASQVGGYSNWSTAALGRRDCGPGTPGCVDGYPPPLIGMTSTYQRIHQYNSDQNLEWANDVALPVHFKAPGNLRNLHTRDASGLGLFDRWGNPLASNSMIYLENPVPPVTPVYAGFPLVYGTDEQMRGKLFLGCQKPKPYACGAVTDQRAEQQPHLQYLKEKDWRLQRPEPTLRGSPTYMGT